MAMSPTASYPGDAVPIVDRLASVPDLAPGPGFAHAVTITGKLAFVSGQVALDSDWYLVDASSVQVIRDVRDEFIRGSLGGRPNPASTLVQVAALFRPELLVEVDAVVAAGG
jgi:enamine deaminase RidA (YjgF/YER057c/UK114 family)